MVIYNWWIIHVGNGRMIVLDIITELETSVQSGFTSYVKVASLIDPGFRFEIRFKSRLAVVAPRLEI